MTKYTCIENAVFYTWGVQMYKNLYFFKPRKRQLFLENN